MFNPTRTKVQLKLAVNRLQMLQNKKNMLAQQQRKEIAQLLEKGKEESARIRVEHIIREDFNCEAMEIIELYCELLLARFGLLEQMKNCDPAILEAVNTVIYAAPRSEVKELLVLRDQLAAKYGREFVNNALENKDESVNPRIIQKLKVQTPDPYLVNRYLEEIARTFNVQWAADPAMDTQLIGSMEGEFLDPPNHNALEAARQTTLKSVTPSHYQQQQVQDTVSSQQLDLLSDLPSTPSFPTPTTRSSSATTAVAPPPTAKRDPPKPAEDDGLPDLDALTRRFEALKKRP
ncbi:hypothetical protein BGW41_003624 [Actinomortierella wolfii]|nr:hypothetical protein BGW41_003624 [Actinomortierella wolfii]